MATSQRQISLFTEDQSTSLPEVSPVSHTQPLANDLARRMTAISGQKCLEQYERLARATSWGRMFAASLIGTGDWYSTKCKLTWKVLATKSCRSYFQLVASMRPIEEIGYGLLLTPSTVEIIENPDDYVARQIKRNALGLNGRQPPGNKFNCLTSQIIFGNMLPTPTTKNASGGAILLNENGRWMDKSGNKWSGQLHDMAKSGLLPTPRVSGHGNSHQRIADGKMDDLTTLARHGMLPTPAAQNYKGASSIEALERRGRLKPMADTLADQFAQHGKTSQLNPRFVAEMMGFPPNWTELPFQSGEQNRLKDMETP